MFNRPCSNMTNKEDLNKENAGIKQVLRKNGCQESIIRKIFKRNTNSLSQLQQQTETTEI